MASLYRDPNSPFWFLKFKNSAGKWRAKSLRPLRHGLPVDTRKAKAIRDQHSLEEHSRSPQRDSWATWVPAYLATRYTEPRRALNAWQRLAQYFEANRITAPQDLTYRACVDYLPWRKGGGAGRKAAHNTALLELKYLAIVCDEAVRRDIITKNPARKLGIMRERGREKPELTDDDIAKIRAALRKKPEWMSHAFEIAIHQGCRLSETAVYRSDVDLERGELRFRKTKGEKPFSVPVNPLLNPLLGKLLGGASDSPRIFELPPNAARDFHRFFKKLGIAGVTFHSTRVTVASRLARGGYSITKAMRLLNHGSELVHRQYQRLQPQDVADAYDVLQIPSADRPSQNQERSAGSPSSENHGAS